MDNFFRQLSPTDGGVWFLITMPNRIIREGFIDSEAVNALSDAGERLYHRLLIAVDDAGRYDGRIVMIKARLFPLSDRRIQEIEKLLSECEKQGLIRRHEYKSKPFIQVIRWQRCGKAETSKYPDKDGSYKISYVQLETRDGAKDFVTSSLPDPIGTPCPRGTEENQYVYGDGDEDDIRNTETETNKVRELSKARIILFFLNEQTGRKFSDTETNLTPIADRIKDVKGDMDGIKKMILRQIKLWKGTKCEEYLQPSTLFRPTNFQGYYDKRDLEVIHGNGNNKPSGNADTRRAEKSSGEYPEDFSDLPIRR